MFLRCNRRKNDGKTHDCWSVVENRRCSDGRVVQRQVALFPAGSMPVDDVDAIGARLSELSLRRPRQWGACWLALQLWQQLELCLLYTSRCV